ncbi:RNA-directed DNA polymerase, eukaryota, Reverse transcriptase zinc-binding domain protein [Artemisia annua]|uniref:RNA-directed DNA polymerase, eukaryota, Reverse transcriptase zinc-binding domain protein n=1 Tax=Artemisia annua TaxID=35608 RepID=A0A2U1LNQ4_ARTAN|nr:RNA-directed DNA polymerase, eukaryota, Reverse transcriptase zinc-binding domain protein [Artemisia annua]
MYKSTFTLGFILVGAALIVQSHNECRLVNHGYLKPFKGFVFFAAVCAFHCLWVMEKDNTNKASLNTGNSNASSGSKSNLFDNAPILKSILKKSVTSSTKTALNVSTAGRQGEVNEGLKASELAAKLKHIDVLKPQRGVKFADYVDVLPTDQNMENVTSNVEVLGNEKNTMDDSSQVSSGERHENVNLVAGPTYSNQHGNATGASAIGSETGNGSSEGVLKPQRGVKFAEYVDVLPTDQNMENVTSNIEVLGNEKNTMDDSSQVSSGERHENVNLVAGPNYSNQHGNATGASAIGSDTGNSSSEGGPRIIVGWNQDDVDLTVVAMDDQRLEGLCKKVFRNWEWTSNGNLCLKGPRIIVGWNQDDVDLTVVAMDDQVIHTCIRFKIDKKELFCSFIYAHNRYTHRRPLWRNLVLHKHYVRNRPWCLLGDFNSALNLEDRVEGSSVIDIAMREFKDCVEEIEVFDINRSGLQFTWNQKPRGTDGKLKKIDRIMTNLACTDGFVGAHAIFQPYRISDHSPAILTIPTSYKFTPRPFKFYNILVQNSQFKRTVKESWDMDVSGFHMYKVVSKLKALKKPLRKLLFNEGNIHDKVVKLRHELDTLGDGSKALAWSDSWCSLSPLANIVSSRDVHRAGFCPTTTVRDIITPNGWAWPSDWVVCYPVLGSMNIPQLVDHLEDSLFDDMCKKFTNSLYGYFIGQRIVFPVVKLKDFTRPHAFGPRFGFLTCLLCGMVLPFSVLFKYDRL